MSDAEIKRFRAVLASQPLGTPYTLLDNITTSPGVALDEAHANAATVAHGSSALLEEDEEEEEDHNDEVEMFLKVHDLQLYGEDLRDHGVDSLADLYDEHIVQDGDLEEIGMSDAEIKRFRAVLASQPLY